MSSYYSVNLENEISLKKLLSHLYVFFPVLDDEKHYWVGEDEIDKLLQKGKDWLETHPEKELIAKRYLRHQRRLTRNALAQLGELKHAEKPLQDEDSVNQEDQFEKNINLNEERLQAINTEISNLHPKSVIDLGCGEAKLIKRLLTHNSITQIVGVDVSIKAPDIARQRLQLDTLPERIRNRVKFLHGSLMYRDVRFSGFTVACVIEVIEHLDPPRLSAFERVLFEFARPDTVILTTPNIEYNRHYLNLVDGRYRHRDHRFEWTRNEFANWSDRVCQRFGYQVQIKPVGKIIEGSGSPTQMGVFAIP